MLFNIAQKDTLLLQNCKLFSEGREVRRDIFIENGIIKVIQEKIHKKASKIIDAEKNIVLPGAIDLHVHFRYPGGTEKEDWDHASRAAAAGGVTTVLDMPNTSPPITSLLSLQNKRKYVADHSIVNYGFYMGATADNIREIVLARNIAGIKVFFGSSTGDLLLNDLEKITELMKTDRLLLFHAEDEKIINELKKKHKNHEKIRDREAEISAIKTLIELARKNRKRIYICHVSTAEGIKLIREAKKEGVDVLCDATPHHIILNDKLNKIPKINPPIRAESDNKALVAAIRAEIIDCIASDHAPHTSAEKQSEKPPSGVPGVETMLPSMLDLMSKGTFSIKSIVKLCCTNPAKIFGIKGKGILGKGYDADIVIINSALEKKVRGDELHSKCGWTPFEGRILKGWPVTTIVNGNVVYDKGVFYEKIKGKEVQFDS